MNNTTLITALIMSSSLCFNLAEATSLSPYAGQESREIKSLSSEDLDGYMSGKGMGLAIAAELNGYPGPAHVLEKAAELGLTADQKQRTEALFKSMTTKDIPLGRSLVEEERNLDRLFATKNISQSALEHSLKRIGELQRQVRQSHLEAHLTQATILTQEQMTKYTALRGYSDGTQPESHNLHHH
jgi:Spy/CpxP family protein refolding chaperone